MATRKRKSGKAEEPPFKSFVVFHARTPCSGWPPIFRNDNDAIGWAVGQGAFPNSEGASRAFAALRRQYGSGGLWARWLGVVAWQMARKQPYQPKVRF